MVAAPSENIQSIAARYYTPPAMDYIPLNDPSRSAMHTVALLPRGRKRGTVQTYAQALVRGNRDRGRRAGRLNVNRGRPEQEVPVTRFTEANHRPNMLFGQPPLEPGQIFRFRGSQSARGGGAVATIEPASTMYSGKYKSEKNVPKAVTGNPFFLARRTFLKVRRHHLNNTGIFITGTGV